MSVVYTTFRFLILLGLWKGILNGYIDTFTMNRNCGGTLKMESEDTYSAAVSFASTDKCDYTIHAYSRQDSLMFYFDSFDIDCEDGHLEIVYSTNQKFTAPKSVYGLTRAVCGDKSSEVYVAPTSYLRLTFQPASGSSVGRVSFKLIITTFRVLSACNSYGYRYSCHNGRCVNRDLRCNGYNPCGDNSDCSSSDATGGTAETVSSVLGSIAFFSCVLCFCRKRKSSNQSGLSECVGGTCNCVVGMCVGICECCSDGCSSVCECTAETARGICNTCHECGSSAQAKCCVICLQTSEPTESSVEATSPALPRTVSAEIQTDTAIETGRTDTEYWADIASAPSLVADDNGGPPSYEAALAMQTPTISEAPKAPPPSYDIALTMV